MKLKEKMQSIFFFTKEAKSEFEIEILKNNLFAGIILLYFNLTFQLYNILSIAIFMKNTTYEFSQKIYFKLYVVLFLVTSLFLIILKIIKKNIYQNVKLFKLLVATYTCIMSIWSIFITLLDLEITDNITVYMLVIFVICVTVYQNPMITATILIVNHAIFITLFTVLELAKTNVLSIYVNSTAVVLTAIIISFSRYCNKILDFKKSRIILRQNKRIMDRNEELKSLAVTDTLSGLYNRRLLDAALLERYNQCLCNQVTFSVIMIDIDDFKEINDIYGHQIGDQCIEYVSMAIRECTQDLSAMLFRYGGEEFAILVSELETSIVMELAENIRKPVSLFKFPYDGCVQKKNLTISIGVYSKIPTDKILPCEYISMADQALYEAKRSGKDKVINFEKQEG